MLVKKNYRVENFEFTFGASHTLDHFEFGPVEKFLFVFFEVLPFVFFFRRPLFDALLEPSEPFRPLK